MNYKKENLLSLYDFASLIEKEGFLSFGEPYVEYKVNNKVETIRLYLVYAQHNVHCDLLTATLNHSVEDVRKNIYSSNSFNNPSLFSDFIKQHKHRLVERPSLDEMNEAGLRVGNKSGKKKLTWLLTQKILNKDYTNQQLNETDFKKDKISKIINQNFDSITKPEQVAYLSRIEEISIPEMKNFLNFPLNWLTKSFLPPEHYTSITLPPFREPNKLSSTRTRLTF